MRAGVRCAAPGILGPRKHPVTKDVHLTGKPSSYDGGPQSFVMRQGNCSGLSRRDNPFHAPLLGFT